MRILLFNCNAPTKNADRIVNGHISFLQDNGHIIDTVSDIDELFYYLQSRVYSAILYYEDNISACLSKRISNYLSFHNITHTAIIVLSPELTREKELSFFSSYATEVLDMDIDHELLLLKVLSIIYPASPIVFEHKGLMIDALGKKVAYKGEDIPLYGKSFDVMLHLFFSYGRIISSSELRFAAWEDPEFLSDNIIAMAIAAIRKKVEKPYDFSFIESNRGRRGYRIVLN